jgi:WD40 repeat protein
VNLHGPVRAATSAGTGDAEATIRFDAWKDGQVAPTKHSIRVEAPRVQLDLEPVAPELRKTLVHPDRKATMGVLQYSPDGGKVFVAGYPSGIVQVFNAATGKELRRVVGPAGGRSSSGYAVPSADWKMAYIAIESRKGERVTKDGKTVFVPKYTGEIRVFDLTTGEEKPPLKRPDNGAVATVRLSPDGKSLRTFESFSRLNEKGERVNSTGDFEWDLTTGTSRKRPDGHWDDKRSKDSRWLASMRVNYQALTARLAVTDTKVGKESVLLDDKNTTLGFVSLAPDGRFLAASVYRHDKGRDVELKVWELGTMREVSLKSLKLDSVMDLNFSPDGSVLAAWTLPGGTRLIDTGTWKERELPGKDAKDAYQRYAFSADGKSLALVGTRYPAGWERSRDPDPLDFPQPRIYLYDLAAGGPPRVMVCPQGFVTKLAFDPTGRWLAAGATGGVWMFEVGK